jgi:hypothetical protein
MLGFVVYIVFHPLPLLIKQSVEFFIGIYIFYIFQKINRVIISMNTAVRNNHFSFIGLIADDCPRNTKRVQSHLNK